jgi:hypothetical protein
MHSFNVDMVVGRALRADKWRVQRALQLLCLYLNFSVSISTSLSLSPPLTPARGAGVFQT